LLQWGYKWPDIYDWYSQLFFGFHIGYLRNAFSGGAQLVIGQLATAQLVLQHFVEGCTLMWRSQSEDILEDADARGATVSVCMRLL